MRRDLNDMYPLDIVNQIKIDSNEMEAEAGIDLVKLVEEGFIEVVGIVYGRLLYKGKMSEETKEIFSSKNN